MFTRTTIQNHIAKALYNFNYVTILAIVFKRLSLKKIYSKIETFVASLVDIIKVLQTKTRINPYIKLLKQYYKFLTWYISGSPTLVSRPLFPRSLPHHFNTRFQLL
jgi:hypothetical protein